MAEDEWRPRGASTLAVEVDDEPSPSTIYVVTCSGVAYAFEEASWATFGRDDDACTIVIWECIRSNELSRVAGVLWCVGGDLWVRNLSSSHELAVHTGAPPTYLSPRAGGRGAACSLGDGGTVGAPSTGIWRLSVERISPSAADTPRITENATVTLPRPPDALMSTAAAMCSPLLRSGGRAATYAEIAVLTQVKNRTARDRVDRLLAFYRGQGMDRLWRDFAVEDSNYAPLARLLVYRSVITSSDLHCLNGSQHVEHCGAD